MKIRLSLLSACVFFCLSSSVFAQTVTVTKDGQTFVCSQIKGSWKPGKIQKKKFITFKKLQSDLKKLYVATALKKYNKQSLKMKNLHIAGLVACSHTCGNTILDVSMGEQCDDGNLVSTDLCTNSCNFPECGDGIVQSDEQCDDGNSNDDDTCPNTCLYKVLEIVAGGAHTCALVETGNVKCWGYGGSGQLGYANVINIGDNETPTSVGDVNVGGTITQVSAGEEHTCALLDTGAVRCWGDGGNGRLGYGNTNSIGDNETPASIGNVDVGGTVTQISAGRKHTCALLDTGAVKCWGDGGNGRLGYGNTNSIGDNETPASIGNVDVGGTVTQISVGSGHTCALLDNGAVRCWGFGGSGQLGYGNVETIGDNEAPANVGDINVGGTVTQISAGNNHTCALLATGAVKCWGYAEEGQLGYGNIYSVGDNETPASIDNVDVGGTVTQISAGKTHTCALLDTGAVKCWGFGGSGQLGYGNFTTIGDNEVPASVGDINVGGTVTQITTSNARISYIVSHTCALLDTGAVRCWGYGDEGNLGYGNINDIGDDETPASAGDVPVL